MTGLNGVGCGPTVCLGAEKERAQVLQSLAVKEVQWHFPKGNGYEQMKKIWLKPVFNSKTI